jgi:hypothetical protein
MLLRDLVIDGFILQCRESHEVFAVASTVEQVTFRNVNVKVYR